MLLQNQVTTNSCEELLIYKSSSSLLDVGAPLKVAKENAGHSDIRAIMPCWHMAQADRHMATRQLSLKNIE